MPKLNHNEKSKQQKNLISNFFRMIGTNEQGVPMVHLYRAVNGATTMVNRELVDRECATWLDTTIVKLDSPLEHPSNM